MKKQMHTKKAQLRIYFLSRLYVVRRLLSPKKFVTLRTLCKYAEVDITSCSQAVHACLDKTVNHVSMIDEDVAVYPIGSICVARDMKEAALAMTHKPIALLTEQQFGDYPCLVVPNVSSTFSRFCHYYRELNKDVHITAVTGSIGNSTTKGMIASVYSEYDKKALYSLANDNSPAMVGYAVQHIPKKCKLMVQEVLENIPNETGYMSKMLEPHVAVIAAIDNSHFEAFESPEGIVKEICSIAEGLQDNGYVVIDKEDMPRAEKYLAGRKVVTVSDADTTADYYAENIQITQKGLKFDVVERETGRREEVRLVNIYARHNVAIALRAFAAGRCENIPYEVIASGLGNYRTLGYRQNVVWTQNGVCLYADCYNSIASSVKAALDTSDVISVKGRRIAVLGDIAECGSLSDEEHDKVVQSVNESAFDVMLSVGKNMNAAVRRGKMRESLQCFPCETRENVVKELRKIVKPGDLVLVKASGAGKLEKVIKALWPEDYHQMITPYIKRRRSWEFYSAIH